MDQLSSVPAATGEWECMECGYVEEGTETRRPKECPECAAPGTAFEFFANEDEDDEWDLGDESGDESGEEDEDEALIDDEDDEDDY